MQDFQKEKRGIPDLTDFEEFLKYIRKLRSFDLMFPKKWEELVELEPRENFSMIQCFLNLTRNELANIWTYVFIKLISFNHWTETTKNFILHLLTINNRSDGKEKVEKALYSLGERNNKQTTWLTSLLSLDDHLTLLPHIQAGLWNGQLCNLLEDWQYNFQNFTIDQMIGKFIGLSHIDKLKEVEVEAQLIKLLNSFLNQVDFVLREKCKDNDLEADNKLKDKCALLSKGIFTFLKNSYELELISKESFLRFGIWLKLPNIFIIKLYQNVASISNDEILVLIDSFAYLEQSNVGRKYDRMVETFLQEIYIKFVRKEESNVNKILLYYRFFLKIDVFPLGTFATQMLVDIAKQHYDIFEEELNHWVKEDLDPYYMTIPRIIAECFADNFDTIFNLIKNWYDLKFIPLWGLIRLLKQVVTTFKDNIEEEKGFPSFKNLINSFFTELELDYQPVINRARERRLQEIAVAIDELQRNVLPLNPDLILQNLQKYTHIDQSIGKYIKKILNKGEKQHFMLKMLNNDYNYLKRLNLYFDELSDISNSKEIKNMLKQGGEHLFDAFAELEVAYYFQEEFSVDKSNRIIEEKLYPRSKNIDFKFIIQQNTTVWVEVKNFFESDESALYDKVVLIDRDKLANNIWDKFQTKFPNITEDEINNITDPFIFALGQFHSFIAREEIQNYLAGTKVAYAEMRKNGIHTKEIKRKSDAMTQLSSETQIVSGILIFKPNWHEIDKRPYFDYIQNPYAKNPLPEEFLSKFNNQKNE